MTLAYTGTAFPFQAEAAAHCYIHESVALVYDLGIGKGHVSMQTAALLFDDALIDLVVVVCEQGKLDEWVSDFATFTTFQTALYYGSKRSKVLDGYALPQVLISTYETIRSDASKVETYYDKKGSKHRSRVDGPFTERLLGQRVLFIYDEVTKLKGRTSQNHKSHEHMLKSLRKVENQRALGLTGTPIEKNTEDFYNFMRIIAPWTMPTVTKFDEEHVKRKDFYGNNVAFKNLNDEDTFEPNVVSFRAKVGANMLRKRKTDPDVIDQFPKLIEEFEHITLTAKQRDFYDTVRETFDDGESALQLFTLMRQIVSNPMSVLKSLGKLQRKLVEYVGEAGLAAVGSAKLDHLVSRLDTIVNGQGAQVVVFDFFGRSVMPYAFDTLVKKGFRVALHTGLQTKPQCEEAKRRFRAGEVDILLSSDKGKRGINLPEASYVIQHGVPLTYADYQQRMGRAHRINSKQESVTNITFTVKDTVEDGILRWIIQRNEWSDLVLDSDVDDEDASPPMTAELRRKLISISAKNPVDKIAA